MMTVLKVTCPPPLESEKLIPNKNTQENSEKRKAHWTKDMNNLFKKGKTNKQTKILSMLIANQWCNMETPTETRYS